LLPSSPHGVGRHPRTVDRRDRGKDELEEPDRSDKRQTLYLPYHVHEALRNIAHNERKSQQELFREAIDWLLRDRGEPSWDELKRRS